MVRAVGTTRGLIGVALAGALLGGCKVGPDYQRPETQMPTGWAGPASQPTGQPSAATTQPADIVQWWGTFNDPALDSLVARAIDSNLDLRQATSRIRQARAQRGIVASGLWPSVDASASYRRAYTGGVPGAQQRDLYSAGLDSAWELDLFGGTRRSIEAAEANVQFTIEDRRAVLVSLISEVAINYIDLRALQQRLEIAHRNAVAQQRVLDLTRRRFEGGLTSGLDVANAQAELATTRGRIPVLESAAQQTIYNLGVLLGRQPAALLDELSASEPIPTTPPLVPVGLPSDLLRRRADIRRAEAQIHAATARIGVATADLFPRFALTGSVGVQGDQLSSLGNWSNRAWSIGPTATWRIFDFGAVRANIEAQKAIQEQSLLEYQRTVLTALQEVESSLIAYAKEQEHRQLLNEAVTANRRAVDLATRLYTEGQTDFLNVLNAQRSLFVSEEALAVSDRDVSTNLVSLYKALGGGWEIETPPATQPSASAR